MCVQNAIKEVNWQPNLAAVYVAKKKQKNIFFSLVTLVHNLKLNENEKWCIGT